ncbi:MAG: pimeloyl-ACP methyl ester esterase BioH [Steroidobacteraceae bacterium]
MSLHVTIQGQGPDLVLLHGWAMHSGVFDELLPTLTQQYRVHCIDLPGHGQSGTVSMSSLAHITAVVQPHLPAHAALMGWSLGGQVALQLARQLPLRALILVSTTPQFVADASWAHGMQPAVFANFFTQLQQSITSTVEGFLRLQVRGDAHAEAALSSLKTSLLRYPAQAQALHAGLDILRDTDLRPVLHTISLPTLVMAGEYDRITHPDASRYLAEQLPRAQHQLINRAGHAPFISNRELFLQQLQTFLAALPSL